MTPPIKEDSTPCAICGGTAHGKSDFHGGVRICSSCEDVLGRSGRISLPEREYAQRMMGYKGIYFNVRQDWGGGENVYLIVGPDGQGAYG